MDIDLLFDNIIFVFLPAAFFLILGICIFIKYSKKQPNEVYRNKYFPLIVSFIPMYIGICIVVRHFFKDRGFGFMILPIFIIVSIYAIVKIIIEMLKSFSKKYTEVEGIVVTYRISANSDTEPSRTYSIFETIKYTVNGTTYYYTDSMSAPFGSKIGKKRITLLVET